MSSICQAPHKGRLRHNLFIASPDLDSPNLFCPIDLFTSPMNILSWSTLCLFFQPCQPYVIVDLLSFFLALSTLHHCRPFVFTVDLLSFLSTFCLYCQPFVLTVDLLSLLSTFCPFYHCTIKFGISYASEAYSCDVTIEFPPTPSWFVYFVFNAQPTCLTLNFNLPVLVKHQF